MSEENLPENTIEQTKLGSDIIDKAVSKITVDISKGYQYLGRKYFPILSQLEDVQLYRIHKSEILSAAQKLVLKYALTEEKLKKATFLQLVQGFEILSKCERLELGQSTENISHKLFGKLELSNK